MSVTSDAYDVYLSFSTHDASVAAVVRQALADGGLDVFTSDTVRAGEDWGLQIHKALAASQALVIVVSRPSDFSRAMLVELGAAMAWKKPIYVLLDGLPRTQVPTFLRGYAIYPISKLADVVAAILQTANPLTDEEQKTLLDLYEDMATPVDRMLTEPALLASLAERFNQQVGTDRSAEFLAKELLTLRKRGAMPRVVERPKRRGRF